MVKPLAIDLFTGLHGFGDAAATEGYRVVGFDIADMCRSTGHPRNPNVQLVLQDVLTVHGSQFKGADLIWASPPCQQYSWLAMPWSRSKSNNSQKAKALRAKWESEGPDNRLFEACFRIQREAIEARQSELECCDAVACFRHSSGFRYCNECYIPMVVENVRGAQEWVGAVFYGLEAWMKADREERWRMGRSAWNFGSFHLWGDVPALMPISLGGVKLGGGKSWTGKNGYGSPNYKPFAFNDECGVKVASLDGGRRTDVGKGARFTTRDCGIEGTKIGGDRFSDPNSTCRKHGSRSSARKAASALIAKIPEELASHIARVYYPR